MKVTQRSVREKFDKLCSDFKEREREEKQASGIGVEYDDNHKALTEIHERVLKPVSYTHLRAHETREDLVCRLLLEKKK